jgi:hypothetical protein
MTRLRAVRRLTAAERAKDRAQLAAGADPLAVDGYDDVPAGRDLLATDGDLSRAGADTRLLGAVGGVHHQKPVLARAQAELLPGGLADLGQRDGGHPEQWVAVAAGLDQLRTDALGELVRARGWTLEQVAAGIKRSVGYVSKRVRVFEDPVLREAIAGDSRPQVDPSRTEPNNPTP